MVRHVTIWIGLALALAGAAPVAAQSSLYADVKAARAAIPGTPTPEQLGALLNRIAWEHRSDGWGLSRKPGGNNCPSPVGPVACDILHHKPTNTLWDVFADVDGAASPAWGQAAYHGDGANRPWVAPADPGPGTGPTNPPPDPLPGLDALAARVAALEAARGDLPALRADLAALGARVDGLAADRLTEAMVRAWIAATFEGLRVQVRVGRAFGHTHAATAEVVR